MLVVVLVAVLVAVLVLESVGLARARAGLGSWAKALLVAALKAAMQQVGVAWLVRWLAPQAVARGGAFHAPAASHPQGWVCFGSGQQAPRCLQTLPTPRWSVALKAAVCRLFEVVQGVTNRNKSECLCYMWIAASVSLSVLCLCCVCLLAVCWLYICANHVRASCGADKTYKHVDSKVADHE